LGGYFDGDGNVGVEVVRYVLRFKLRFSDTWENQIKNIKLFLNAKGVTSGSISHDRHPSKKDAYRLDVDAIDSALKAAKAMVPYCAKKAEDLRIMIDYLEGRITGNQAIARLNEEVRLGRRSGFERQLTLPYTRPDGLRVAQLENARNARSAYAVHVSESEMDQIRKDHHALGLGHIRLGKKYGYSVHVIRRILGSP